MENYTYRLIELKDQIDESLDNVAKVIAKSELLNKIIEESAHAEEMKEFLDSNKEQIEKTRSQIGVLESRKAYLEKAIEKLNSDEKYVEFMFDVFSALGIFDNN